MSSVKRPVSGPAAAIVEAVQDGVANVVGQAVQTGAGSVTEVVDAASAAAAAALRRRDSSGEKRPARVRADGRRERWAEHRKARRAELIEAATDAVIEYGANVGMDQIAATAKTSKTVIYRYFSDKADLHQAVAEQAATRLIEGLVAALEGVTAPRDTLAAGVNAFLTEIEDRPEVYRFVMMRVNQSAETHDERRQVMDYPSIIGELVSMQIGFYMKTSGLDPVRSRPWGVAIVGFIRAASEWWLEHREVMSREELGEYLTSLLWSGMGGLYQSNGWDVDITPTPGVFPTLPQAERELARTAAENGTGTDITAAIAAVARAVD